MDHIENNLTLMRRIKSSQLVLLLALAEHGSLRRAAEVAGTTQPAASRLLFDLEQTVGHELFERHPRGLRPNEFGQVMIQHAQMVLAGIDRAKNEITSLFSGFSGVLRIGAIPSVVPVLLSETISRIKQHNPHLKIICEVATSNLLVSALSKGRLDIVLGRPRKLHDFPTYEIHGSIDEELVVCCRHGHPLLSERQPVRWTDLAKWPWCVLPEGSPMRLILASAFHGGGTQEPINRVETASFMLAISLLSNSDTLSLMPRDVLNSKALGSSITELEVEAFPAMGPYKILIAHGRENEPLIKYFIQILDEVNSALSL